MEFSRPEYWIGSFPGSSVGKESACNAGDPSLIPGSGRSPEEGIGYPPVFLGFLCGSAGKESACNVGDLGSIPALGRSPGEGHGNPLQSSCLENPHGQRCLVGYSPWGCKESAERLSTAQHSMLLMIPPFFLSTFILGSAKSRHSIKNIYK